MKLYYGGAPASGNKVSFACSAVGYPLPYAGLWYSSTGGKRYNSSRKDLFPAAGDSVLQIILTDIDVQECIRDGGYSCEFYSALPIDLL